MDARGDRRVVVVPHDPGPLISLEPGAGRGRDDLDELIDDLFPDVDERPGWLDGALVALGAGLLAWGWFGTAPTIVTVLGVLVLSLGCVLPMRAAWRRTRRRGSRAAGKAWPRGASCSTSRRPRSPRWCAPTRTCSAPLARSGSDDSAIPAAHVALLEVATLLKGRAPASERELDYVGKRAAAVANLAGALRDQAPLPSAGAGTTRTPRTLTCWSRPGRSWTALRRSTRSPGSRSLPPMRGSGAVTEAEEPLAPLTDDEPEVAEPLGSAGRILAVPLVPFVMAWEAAKAGTRAVAAGFRGLGSALAAIGKALRQVATIAGRAIVWPVRRGAAALRALARIVVSALRAALRLARPVWAALTPLTRRIGVALRAAVRAVVGPVRARGAGRGRRREAVAGGRPHLDEGRRRRHSHRGPWRGRGAAPLLGRNHRHRSGRGRCRRSRWVAASPWRFGPPLVPSPDPCVSLPGR